MIVGTLNIKKNNVNNIKYKINNFFNKYYINNAFFFYLNYRIFYEKFSFFYDFEQEETWILLKKSSIILYCIKNEGPYKQEINAQTYLYIPYHPDPKWYIPLNWITTSIVYMDNVISKTYAANNQYYYVFSILKQLLSKIIEQPDNDPYSSPKLRLKQNLVPKNVILQIPLYYPTNNQLAANIAQAVIIETTTSLGPVMSGSQRITYRNNFATQVLKYNDSIPNDDPLIAEIPLTVPGVEFINNALNPSIGFYPLIDWENVNVFLVEYPIIGNSVYKTTEFNPTVMFRPQVDNIIRGAKFNGIELVPDALTDCVYDSTLYLSNNGNNINLGIFYGNGTSTLTHPNVKWYEMYHRFKSSDPWILKNNFNGGNIGFERYYNFPKNVGVNYILPNEIQNIAIYNVNQVYKYQDLDYMDSIHTEEVAYALKNNPDPYSIVKNYISDASNWISINATTQITTETFSSYNKEYYATYQENPYTKFKKINNEYLPSYQVSIDSLVEGIRTYYIPDKYLIGTNILIQRSLLFPNVSITTDSNGNFLFAPKVTNLLPLFDNVSYIGIKSKYLKNKITDLNNNEIKLDPFYNWTISSPLARFSTNINTNVEGPILNLSTTYINKIVVNKLLSYSKENFLFYIQTKYPNIKFKINLQLIFV